MILVLCNYLVRNTDSLLTKAATAVVSDLTTVHAREAFYPSSQLPHWLDNGVERIPT